VPLSGSERRYHRGCRQAAKRVSERQEVTRQYRDGERQACLNRRHGVHYDRLRWSIGPDAAPVYLDSYIDRRQAVLCSEDCLVEYYDDHPELEKPAAYRLILSIPKDARPKAEPISANPTKPDVLDYIVNDSGHKHSNGRCCEVCMYG
jgi:hypothetical protein